MHYSTASKQSRDGFTLVELITALFVLSAGAFGAFHLYSLNMSQTQEMVQEQQATTALMNMMEIACADLPAVGQHGPDPDTRVLLERLRDPVAGLVVARHDATGLYEVTANITWQARTGRNRQLSFTTFRAPDPTMTTEEADHE